MPHRPCPGRCHAGRGYRRPQMSSPSPPQSVYPLRPGAIEHNPRYRTLPPGSGREPVTGSTPDANGKPSGSGREFAGRAGFIFRRQVAVDGEVVEEAPGEGAGERGDDRDPEVPSMRQEDRRPPAQEGRGESRAEV